MFAKDPEHVTVKWLVIESDLHKRENMATGQQGGLVLYSYL